MNLLESRVENLEELLRAARGDIPLDMLIKDADILNVMTGETLRGDIGVHKGFIVTVIDGKDSAKIKIKGAGKTIIPAFIDPHIHVESSMVLPNIYANVVASQGTGTVFADPHEIVNVMGVDGFRLMLNNSRDLPVRLFFDAPTCVPSKRGIESSGADIQAADIDEMIQLGAKKLGELMSIDEIISGDPIMMDIIKTGWKYGIPRDAHFPTLELPEVIASLGILQKVGLFSGLIGSKLTKGKWFNRLPARILSRGLRKLDRQDLDAYMVMLGPTADHENIGPDIKVKLDHGMHLQLKIVLKDFLGVLVTEINKLRYKDCIGICTDDIWPDELVTDGGMIGVIKELVNHGLDPVDAVRFGTLNNAQRLAQRGIQEASLMGAVAPGLVADLVVLSGKLKKFTVDTVIHEGRIIARNGKILVSASEPVTTREALNSVRVNELSEEIFSIKAPGTIQDGDVLTRVISVPRPPALPLPVLVEEAVPVDKGILDTRKYTTITAINRYGKGKKSPSKGLIKGFSLKNGAIASTVAHDCHNLIVLGSNASDMFTAATEVVKMNGGIAVSRDNQIIAHLPLSIGGLMSAVTLEETVESAKKIRGAFKTLRLDPANPVLPFALFSLPAIPGPKVTDLGLWDDRKKALVPLFVLNE